ncbi:Mitogen-activated protein kinase [Actinidia chinensis var. chinensis]|uniref:Mitogen-activated protein kinase n=1 Tax=Actinidia chinensis var. chinensis TaxID=1590841 RepID=A0A2R6QPE4_ACTCC|nr:Mitogen-activated protein kinase [Actinidia chinensis var. chinensis]
MSLVRERRNQQALRLSVPPPVPAVDFFDLEKLEVLGHGNGCTAYKAQQRHTASVYALKVLQFNEDAVVVRQQAARETEILKQVDSQLIVKCHGVFHNGVGDSDCAGCDLCFVMEYMEAGSLHDIFRMRQRLPEYKTVELVDKQQRRENDCGFRVSGVVTGKLEATHDPYMGISAYMSPERFDPERWDGDFSNGFSGDVWSLGLVVWECHSGAKTGLGDVNVCYLLWREDEDAGHGISGVSKFCVEMFGKGLKEERDSDRASYPPFCDKMV